MTHEWMLKTLVDLGFSQGEAEVCVFRAQWRTQSAAIAEALGTQDRESTTHSQDYEPIK